MLLPKTVEVDSMLILKLINANLATQSAKSVLMQLNAQNVLTKPNSLTTMEHVRTLLLQPNALQATSKTRRLRYVLHAMSHATQQMAVSVLLKLIASCVLQASRL